ncbi:glycosyltransferase family 34 protein [Melanomma pulvis-pyrius CBS 109.77]|uniref:Glycosyltransferase family 34 protein n=1 Tax=Melanomma pulvis-pyrius CBS 109.77 TaxID=1314802 RepID=A0A6A6WY61_9PLEO|nr:glycosyltransferase family 34 protein [Melanomma pulvis-pyrius CBS 109.77]
MSKYLPSSVDGIEAQESLVSTENGGEDDDDNNTEAGPALEFKNSLTEATIPNDSTKSPYPRFGKITASFGEPDVPYENAIASHNLHNELHGYPHFILRERMLRGLWSKHAYIMTIIGQELAKPEDQRLQWLLWHDRDTVLMNPQLPLDIFVPPEPEFANIHFLVTNDRHGLNNGVFLCRVSQLSFKFFASALSIREYQPEIPLKYTEQSGMEEVIKRPWWSTSVAYVPQRWFNGFPPDKKGLAKGKPSASRPGSLLIHFASNRDGLRPERMAQWGEVAKNRTAEWDKPASETGYLKEIAEYWERLGKGESQESVNKDIGIRRWE